MQYSNSLKIFRDLSRTYAHPTSRDMAESETIKDLEMDDVAATRDWKKN